MNHSSIIKKRRATHLRKANIILAAVALMAVVLSALPAFAAPENLASFITDTSVNDPNPEQVTIGQSIDDRAVVVGASTVPTGTITFKSFGPDNATCSGTPAFTSTNPLVATGFANESATDSAPFTPTTAGSYRWTAAYSGDSNNNPQTMPCNEPNELSIVDKATPTLTTQAFTTNGGQTIQDTATLSGGENPTGTITFNIYGPGSPNCGGNPVSTSTKNVNGNGSYTSDPYTPATQTGSYDFVVVYSGDANNASVTSPCHAPNETTDTTAVKPTITTQVSKTNINLGESVTDSATITGKNTPTGAITFSAFGPNNGTCVNPPAFVSDPIPVNGNGTYTSNAFTPTAGGVYRFKAFYNGDANNEAVTTGCNDANEQFTVFPACTIDLSAATEGHSIRGTDGPDVICGSPFKDSIRGGDGDDLIFGNGGDDTLRGQKGSDTIYGGAGADKVRGARGNDTMFGEIQDDHLRGGADTDNSNGGPGFDKCRSEAAVACEDL